VPSSAGRPQKSRHRDTRCEHLFGQRARRPRRGRIVRLDRPYRVDGRTVELDASVGWALFPQDGLAPEELLAQADGQMYATKRDSSQEDALPYLRSVDRGVIRDFESALERGQIVVHYQPIVDVRSGAVRAAEALVRRAHPDRLVTPSEFIPHVEQTPLVKALTLAVADDALRRIEEWEQVGHSLDAAATLGPVISKPQLDKVLSYIDVGRDDGAELLQGGERLGGDYGNGYFVQPSVFGGVTNQMRIAREEIFGPVLSILPFDDVDEAIAIANDSDYGLGGAVWSQNISTALRVVHGVHTGTMWVNCYGYIDPLVGFSGTKRSGYGAKGSAAHMDTYLYTKSVYVQL